MPAKSPANTQAASQADLLSVQQIVENLLVALERLAKEPGMKDAARRFRAAMPDANTLTTEPANKSNVA